MLYTEFVIKRKSEFTYQVRHLSRTVSLAEGIDRSFVFTFNSHLLVH